MILYKYIRAEHVANVILNGISKLTRLRKSNDPCEFCPAQETVDWSIRTDGKEPIVLCVTPNVYNPVMWERYGIQKKGEEIVKAGGAAVIYDFPIRGRERYPFPLSANVFLEYFFTNNGIMLLKCIYGSQPIPCPQSEQEVLAFKHRNDALKEACFRSLCLMSQKESQWEDENEFRVYRDDSEYHKNNCLLTRDYAPYMTGIILGEQFSYVSDETIRTWRTQSFRPDFKIFKMESGMHISNFE